MIGVSNRETAERYYQRLSLVYQKPEIRAPIGVILSVFTTVFLIMTAIRPTLVTVTELKKKITDQKRVEKKLEVKIASLIEATKQINDYGDSLALFVKAVPEKKVYGDLAKKIELAAWEKNVVVESLNFSSIMVKGDKKVDSKKKERKKWVDGKASVREFSVNFDVLGDETALVGFLREIENFDRVGVISKLDLIKVEEKNTLDKKIRAKGELDSYYLLKAKM